MYKEGTPAQSIHPLVTVPFFGIHQNASSCIEEFQAKTGRKKLGDVAVDRGDLWVINAPNWLE